MKVTHQDIKNNKFLKYVYSIYDTSLSKYDKPFILRDGEINRFMQMQMSTMPKDEVLYRFSNDFQVHCLATFDEENGKFENSQIMNCGVLSKWKQQEKAHGIPAANTKEV